MKINYKMNINLDIFCSSNILNVQSISHPHSLLLKRDNNNNNSENNLKHAIVTMDIDLDV